MVITRTHALFWMHIYLKVKFNEAQRKADSYLNEYLPSGAV